MYKIDILDSSVVEQSAVNRLVVGSNPTRGDLMIYKSNFCKYNPNNGIYFKTKIIMTKRTFGGTRRKAIKVIGFRTRMNTIKGRKVLSNRRKKGRKILTILKRIK